MIKLPQTSVKKGDTIVEVLFALAAFGFVAMAAMVVMQQGSSSAQLSLEISIARNHMNSQAEAIRFINAAAQARERDVEAGESSEYAKLWDQMIAQAGKVSDWGNVITKNSGGRAVCSNIPSKSFILDIKNLSNGFKEGSIDLRPATVFPRLVYRENYGFGKADNNEINAGDIFDSSEGIWIQVEKSGENFTSTSYDFHIRSCWESPGKSTPIKLGTIVRVHIIKESA